MQRARLSMIILLALATTLLAVSPASAREYWIVDFGARISVAESGEILVTETIRFYFDGSYQGVYRDIPLRYSDDLGFSYKLRLSVRSVTDGDGNALDHSLSRSGGSRRIKVWVPGAQDTTRTVEITYLVGRALRFFPEHDELYWNVTGNSWGVPIQAASAQVDLPAALEERPRVTAFVGRYGGTDDSWNARTSTRQAVFETTRELSFGEGLTIVVGWPKGIVTEPTMRKRVLWWLSDNWPMLIPPLVLLFMLGVWMRFGRDPDVGRSIMPLYDAPADLTPAELGTLVDQRADQRDIVATVIDLAVRGYLRIEESTEDGWLFDTTTTTFHKLQPAGDGLRPHEREVLEGIFEKGDSVTLDDLENTFYTRIDTINGHLYKGLVKAGYFRSSPRNVRIAWVVIGVLVMAGGPMLGVVSRSLAGAVAGILSGIIVLAFAWAMPARTRSGRNKWIEIKGFEEFLGRTEGERLRAMEVDVAKFERFLPFALALGVAEQWGRAFEGLLREPPRWYASTHAAHFSAIHFSKRMSAVSDSVGVAMTSAPRSSSGSSGFSGGGGGGFSGGGFGGGGGGAF